MESMADIVAAGSRLRLMQSLAAFSVQDLS